MNAMKLMRSVSHILLPSFIFSREYLSSLDSTVLDSGFIYKNCSCIARVITSCFMTLTALLSMTVVKVMKEKENHPRIMFSRFARRVVKGSPTLPNIFRTRLQTISARSLCQRIHFGRTLLEWHLVFHAFVVWVTSCLGSFCVSQVITLPV